MDSFLVSLWILSLLLAAYFAPSMIALNRRVPSKWSVVVINALLGWTLIGWAVALAMAVRDKPSPVANQYRPVSDRVDVERRAVGGDGL